MKKVYCLICLSVMVYISASGQTFTLLKDINPGIAGSSPGSLANINGQLFFSADDGVNGLEFWKSDGTGAGTQLFMDINPGPGSSAPAGFIIGNGLVYFRANDGVHGDELWKSDGTVAGTVMVKDINPGAGGSSVGGSCIVNGIIFFSATDGVNGYELWKSDGTEAGTVMVKNINTHTNSPSGPDPGPNSYPSVLTEMNGFLYLAATDGLDGWGLWKSDGTTGGTVLLSRVTIGQMRNINNTLIFSVGDPASQLWRSDGTTAGTVALKSANGILKSLTNVNGTAFYWGETGSNTPLWKSDGTFDGTVIVKTFISPGIIQAGFVNVNGKLFFLATDPAAGKELWTSDGTLAGTTIVKDIYPGATSSQPGSMTAINNTLYFSASDGVNGWEIWKSNGTSAGTLMVQDIANPGDALPAGFTLVGSKIFVSVTDNSHGRELWVTDLNSNSPLPLTLTDIKGQLSGNDGLLKWKTSSEQNTSDFEIERSLDGRFFVKTGTVAASNNSSTGRQYTYTDRNITMLNSPVVYYRLKMKDVDAKFVYSKIIAININSKEAVVMLYPNPVRETATLMIAARKKEKITYSITDQNGRTVRVNNSTIDEGSNMIPVEMASLASGVYTLSINGQYTKRQIKLVKQ